MTVILLEIRRPDGSIEHVEVIGGTTPAADVVKQVTPLADIYAGTGYSAVLIMDDDRELVVGTFDAVTS